MTLSHKMRHLLSTLSKGDKLRAEHSAAEAAQRLSVLDGHARTLSSYTTALATRLLEDGVENGFELKSYGQFIEMSIRAGHQNAIAITAGEAAQVKALDTLARATEKHKALRQSSEDALAVAARDAERDAERRG
ncbi:hypothetical protein FGG78_19015 [Thioclava sp. BHET1]|nr:hypothetical protein FGG78_19015 [Thioclava sp. BHET1]